MCSYHGMFPAKVAHYFIQRHSRPGDLVLDPFSGRGTVPLQARVEGRRAICNDLNPLAYVLSRAKSNPPSWRSVLSRIEDLQGKYRSGLVREVDAPDDIRMLYHPNTLRQISYLRDYLLSNALTKWDLEKYMIGGALAGIMHGSFRRDGTSQYLSISMPNTFSMSPSYVQKYIIENGLSAPDQDVFECLRDKIARLYLDDIEGIPGRAYHADAVNLMAGRRVGEKSVDLIVTSPPYLQVVNYGTANWIRLWLLGVEEVGRERGAGRKTLDSKLDHGHTYQNYKVFLQKTLSSARRVLKPEGIAVFVIGDVADRGKEPLPLAAQIWKDVGPETGLQLVEMIEDHLPVQNKVSRIWGDTKGQATSRDCALVLARNDAPQPPRTKRVDWDEPYKDGGPDAAHQRANLIRLASAKRAQGSS
ncbi:DNA methyltransferase [Actinoplanes sp. CA-142083]|uniref:DNA methyltransferase n=1 Tax=Actinoplanes sp. CA-142083 TaxID=3239903 RepID=UPI003D91E917